MRRNPIRPTQIYSTIKMPTTESLLNGKRLISTPLVCLDRQINQRLRSIHYLNSQWRSMIIPAKQVING